MRGLLEKNLVEMAWCPGCRSVSLSSSQCSFCGHTRKPLAEGVCRRITQACRRDQKLVSRIKAEAEDRRIRNPLAALPTGLPPWWKVIFERLPWLEQQWIKARPHRPAFQARKHWLIITSVGLLRDRGLSVEEAVEVLTEPECFPDGPVKHGRKDYAGVDGKGLRRFGENFRRRAAELEVSPALSVEEVWRTLAWGKRQSKDRWSGERPRRRRH